MIFHTNLTLWSKIRSCSQSAWTGQGHTILICLDSGQGELRIYKTKVWLFFWTPCSKEHQQDATNFSSKSHVIKHWMITHPERPERPPFAFSIISQYRDCLTWQIGEAIWIQTPSWTAKTNIAPNSLTIQEEDWQKRKREITEEVEKMKEKIILEEFNPIQPSVFVKHEHPGWGHMAPAMYFIFVPP